MPITNFSFRSPTGSDRTADLFRNSSRYDGPDLFRYPIDLGSTSKEHYMILHVNEQKRTAYPGETTNDLPQIYENINRYGGGNVAQTTAEPLLEWVGKGLKQYIGVDPRITLRTIRRTTDTIALYMPDTLNFSYNQHYDDLRLSGVPTAVLAAGASLVDSFKGMDLKSMKGSQFLQIFGKNLSPFAFNYLAQNAPGDFRDISRLGFAGYFGFVQNPQLEVLYSSPRMREFNFEFMFYPRSEKEAEQVQSILNLLRFHQAPEVVREFNGFFLTPPSEFDIKFYYNGMENPNIPKISTCILHSINVDYAPGGFAAYETQSRADPTVGGTGMPVAIRLSLGFREREIMTKSHFAKDAGKGTSTTNYRGEVTGDGTELGR